MLRKIYGLFCFFVFPACTTMYTPSYRYVDRTYQPEKKGLVQLEAGEYFAFVNAEGIRSREEAYRMGLINVKQSIKRFCGGKFSIQNISRKRERDGTKTVKSTVQDTNSFGHFDIAAGSSYKTQHPKRKYGVVYEPPAVSHGHTQESSRGSVQEYSRTKPVYREYELISFRCQK